MQAVGFIKGFLTPDRSTTVGADESRTTSAPPATSAAESPQRLLSVVQESQERLQKKGAGVAMDAGAGGVRHERRAPA